VKQAKKEKEKSPFTAFSGNKFISVKTEK